MVDLFRLFDFPKAYPVLISKRGGRIELFQLPADIVHAGVFCAYQIIVLANLMHFSQILVVLTSMTFSSILESPPGNMTRGMSPNFGKSKVIYI